MAKRSINLTNKKKNQEDSRGHKCPQQRAAFSVLCLKGQSMDDRGVKK